MNRMNPRQVLHLDRYLNLEQELDIRSAQSQGHTIQVRVEWDGGANLGTFGIRNLAGQWEAVGNLSGGDSANDLILAGPRLLTDPILVQIQRGPKHGDCPFKAWAYAVAWKAAMESFSSLSNGFTAMRDVHYEYDQQEPVCHVQSAPDGDQIQTALLTLKPGFAYEVWVALRHPTNVDAWCIQDPIVSPGDRTGSPTPH